MDIASVFLLAVTALLIAAVWYTNIHKRAIVSGGLQRQYAEQAAETQRLLTDVSAQLTDLNQRTADMHRILKDAECPPRARIPAGRPREVSSAWPPCAAALRVRAGWRTAGRPAPVRRALLVVVRAGPAAHRVRSGPAAPRGAGPRRPARPRGPGLAPDTWPGLRRRPG